MTTHYKNVNDVPAIKDVARPNKIFMDGFLASFKHNPTEVSHDWRLLENGMTMHAENHYVDEPFIVKADDGAWVCAMTIGDWQEADKSQRTTVRRSVDMGKTWSEPVDIEPADGPEGSKAVLLKTNFGRLYAFIIVNTGDLREVPGDNPPYENGICTRVDSLGEFCYRYSDDHGVTWSRERFSIPMREFEIDRENPLGGSTKLGMNSAIPLVLGSKAYVPFTKVGSFGEGLFSRSEGVLFMSPNIMDEQNVDKLTWETLPDGEVGMRAPDGAAPIAEEHSFCALSDGTIHCVFRTIDGWPAVSYSRDEGHTWTEPVWMTYADGRRVKCPRAADFAWRTEDGRYLYWYHNHGGQPFLDRIGENSHYSFEDRNPVWFCGGREVDAPDGKILEWSQPEIVLYTDDPIVRISYPDLLEDDGRYFLTETNKDIARIHEVDGKVFEALWAQFTFAEEAVDGLVLDAGPGTHLAPWLPDFAVLNEKFADYRTKRSRRGFSIDLWLNLESNAVGQILIDNRTSDGRGFWVQTAQNGTLEFGLRDDMTDCRWTSDAGCIVANQKHHVAVIVDGGPNTISFVIDGKFNDGGDERQFGWGRFSHAIETPKGADELTVGTVDRARLYDRAILVSEAVGNWKAKQST